jgi:neutral ceramidase
VRSARSGCGGWSRFKGKKEPLREAARLQCGVARRDISPPPGIDLSGFIARDGPCTGVHDPLTATALVAADGVTQVALVCCDLIGLGAAMVRRLRAAVEVATGIPAGHQMYACTHTHGGPETGVITSTGAADPAYLHRLERTLVELINEASATIAPARIRWQRGQCPVAVNRRAQPGEAGPVDPELIVVAIEDGAGRPLAALLHYSCHPVAAGSGNRLATADWCGVARHLLEAAGSGPVLVVNGAAGDVNPRMAQRGLPAVDDAGRAIGATAVTLWRQAALSEQAGVAALQASLPLTFCPLADLREVEMLWEQWQRIERDQPPDSVAYRGSAVTRRDHSRRLVRLHWGSDPLPVYQAEVQVLRIGPAIVAALPGEFFSGYGRQVKAAAPEFPVLVAGWTNDNLGYFPTREAYPQGGYEVEIAYRYYGYPAAWSAEAGEAVANEAAQLVGGLAE